MRNNFLRYRMPGITSLLNPLKRSLLGCSEGYSYRGVPMQKNPIDLAIYSMLLWDLKPKTIIEIGSKAGGSALWLADQCRSYNTEGYVISIDLKPPKIDDPDISFLYGDAKHLSLDPPRRKPWLVIEDSAHDYETTMAVLEFFDHHVKGGDYVVVEDVHVPEVNKAVKDWLTFWPRYQTDHHYQDFWGFSDHAYMKLVKERQAFGK